jgi:ribonuclease HI
MGSKIDLSDIEIVFLDLETSSLKPDADILAIGGLITDKDLKIKETFNYLIKPKDLSKADPKALELIGYSEEKWQKAKELKEVLEILYPKFKNKILAGWISHFDWARLEKAFYENGFDDPFDYRKIDIFSIALAKYGLTNLGNKETLTKLCNFLNISRGNPHSAYDDAYASYQVFLKITQDEKNNFQEIVVYTDGSFIYEGQQKGKSFIGVVIFLKNKKKEYSKEVKTTSHNQAEYLAIIFALEKLKQILGKEKISKTRVIIKTDSELVGKQINGEYKVLEPELFPYFIKVNNLKIDFGEIKIEIIPREENLADKLTKNPLF